MFNGSKLDPSDSERPHSTCIHVLAPQAHKPRLQSAAVIPGDPATDDWAPQVKDEGEDVLLSLPDPFVTTRSFTVVQIRTVQHAFSRSELNAIRKMYNWKPNDRDPLRGKIAISQGEGWRTLTAGDGAMARLLGVSTGTVRNLRMALQDKLAVEIKNNGVGPNAGKTWIVYSFDNILRRLKTAGYLYASLRPAGAVAVCDTAGEVVAPRALVARGSKVDLTTLDPSNLQSEKADPSKFVHLNQKVDGSKFAAHINNSINNKLAANTNTKEALVRLEDAANRELEIHLGQPSPTCATKIATSILNITPDATEDDVIVFIDQELPAIVSDPGTKNTTGLLIWKVKPCFTPDALARRRSYIPQWYEERYRQMVRGEARCRFSSEYRQWFETRYMNRQEEIAS
jgi:hypothetical protein